MSPTGTSPSAVPSSPPLGVGLSCKLPVTWTVTSGATYTTNLGFVTFPSQEIAVDKSAPAGSLFYDRAFKKWLPVGRESVSPDGKRYAYSEGSAYLQTTGKLHVVDVESGADRIIYSGPTVYAVVDFAAEGIYVTAAAPEGRPHGLWLQNAAGGPARLISRTIVGPKVGGGAAWGLGFNAPDPSPGPGGIEGPKNQVLRVDLETGAQSGWFYRPGSDLYPLGFDSSGHLFVSAAFDSPDSSGLPLIELWLLGSATSAKELMVGTGGSGLNRLGAVDSHGVWLEASYVGGGTIWLYAAGTMRMVAKINVDNLSIAGGCIP